MMTEATPRINASYLESFQGQTVRLIGKVTQLRGEQATIDANGSVTATLNRDCHLVLNNAVEIVGKVNPDLTVRVLAATDFGSNINFAAVDAVVNATHRHKEIFYESSE
ncbi:replication factor A protein 3 [Xylona heveae TC161]|uniref:Replication factor A protein 3 n=1 Tax=Xylona heveae (strain CBS 132557 / TC161) TaxID=1328760 RepID=A0A165JU93_XYLHT|nr:replication factor A protein 3 [Xylona heveae TC161]KZF26636.1 replication factor A protein 3 [Xylona heveae TC161]